MSIPVVVVGGSKSSNQLGIIRAFGERNIPVYQVVFGSETPTKSRYCKQVFRLADYQDLQQNSDAVPEFLRIHAALKSKAFLLPTSDNAVLLISKIRSDLRDYFYIPVADHPTVKSLVEKHLFYELLKKYKISHPRTFSLTEANIERLRTGKEISFPILLKPANSQEFSKVYSAKCFQVDSWRVFEKYVQALVKSGIHAFIQEYIPGNTIYMYYAYFDATSTPLAVVGYDKVRQYPPDFGSGSYCVLNLRKEVIDPINDFLRSIHYVGIAEPELKFDYRDNTYKLLEINARTSTQNRLPAKAGLDMEFIAYQDLVYGRKPTQAPKVNRPVKWVDLAIDLPCAYRMIQSGQLTWRKWFSSILGVNVEARFSFRDPLPFLYSIADIVSYKLRQVFP